MISIRVCLLAAFLLLYPSLAYTFPYKGTDVKIRLIITEMYDDNVTFSREERKGDFITRMELNFALTEESRRSRIELGGDISRGFYARYSDIKDSTGQATLNFTHELSEYDRVTLKVLYSRYEYPLTFEEEFGRVSGRYSTYNSTFGINYFRDISEHFSINTAYTHRINRSSRRGSIRSYNNNFRVRVDYIHDIYSTFFLTYNGSRTGYEGRDSITNHTLAVGMRQYITKRLFLDGSAGANYLSTFGFAKNFIEVALTDEIDQRTTARLSFVRRDQSVSDRRDVFSNWRVNSTVTRGFLKRMEGSFSIFYGRGRFEISDVTQRLVGLSSGINYMFNEHLSGSLHYNYSNFDSSNELQGYSRNTLQLGIIMAF